MKLLEACPILVTRDLATALARYRLLGFDASAYTDPNGTSDFYGYLERDGIRLHVTRVHDIDPVTSVVSVYL